MYVLTSSISHDQTHHPSYISFFQYTNIDRLIEASTALFSGRHLLQEVTPLNCTPRAIHQFPDDFMTEEQRQKGGVAFHIFISLYLFVATAIACDDFFVPALEKICEGE